jgi:DNA-directed RNA polymerase specialized sigma24 family protein
MSNVSIASEGFPREADVMGRFLEAPNDETFADLFKAFTPQLVAFFRARSCDFVLAEDLAQEVMLIVHRKASQIRNRTLFRAWLFKVARHALCGHYDKRTREVETVDLGDVAGRLAAASHEPAGTPAFEFLHWMAVLDSRERDVMTLRFHRAVGIPRDRRRTGHPNRDGAVEGVQCKEKARALFEDAQTRCAAGWQGP